MGPAKSSGRPHRPAGMRSEIWRKRVGSARSFSFLYGLGEFYVSIRVEVKGKRR